MFNADNSFLFPNRWKEQVIFVLETTVENNYFYLIQTLTDKIFKDDGYLKLRYSPFKTTHEKMSLTNQNYIDCY